MGQIASQLCNNDAQRQDDKKINDTTPYTTSSPPSNTSLTKKRKVAQDKKNTVDSNKKSDDSIKQTIDPAKKNQLTYTDFEVIKNLGSGAFGEVYQVKKKSNNKQFAMKSIKKSKIQHGGLAFQMAVEKDILLHNRHPFLVNLRYAFQTDKRLYLVMDLCQGGELLSYIHMFARMNISESVSRFIAAEVLLGLEYMHKNLQTMYRDLKPENILVCDDGHLKIADFGLAKHFENQCDKTREVCGTLEYLAPEIILSHQQPDFVGYGYEADIWAFGIFIFEVIVGEPPFTHPQRNPQVIMQKILKNKFNYPVGFKEDAKDLISKCLNSVPSERPSWDEIKRHSFFSLIEWDKLQNKEIMSPLKKYIPKYKEYKREARPIIDETKTDEVYKSVNGFYYAPLSLAKQISNQ